MDSFSALRFWTCFSRRVTRAHVFPRLLRIFSWHAVLCRRRSCACNAVVRNRELDIDHHRTERLHPTDRLKEVILLSSERMACAARSASTARARMCARTSTLSIRAHRLVCLFSLTHGLRVRACGWLCFFVVSCAAAHWVRLPHRCCVSSSAARASAGSRTRLWSFFSTDFVVAECSV